MNIQDKEVIKDTPEIEDDSNISSEQFNDFMEELIIEQQGGGI